MTENSTRSVANKVRNTYCKTKKKKFQSKYFDRTIWRSTESWKAHARCRLPDTDTTYGELMRSGLFIWSKGRICLVLVLLYILDVNTYVIPHELLKYDLCEVWYGVLLWQWYRVIEDKRESLKWNLRAAERVAQHILGILSVGSTVISWKHLSSIIKQRRLITLIANTGLEDSLRRMWN